MKSRLNILMKYCAKFDPDFHVEVEWIIFKEKSVPEDMPKLILSVISSFKAQNE